MKNSNLICLILVSITLSLSCQQNNTAKTVPVKQEISIVDPDISIGVRGNCGMCKTTIEKAALSVDGVEEASWGIDTKIIDLKLKEEFDIETYKAYLELHENWDMLKLEYMMEVEGIGPEAPSEPLRDYYGPMAESIKKARNQAKSELDSLVKITPNLTLLIKIHEAIAKSGYDTGLISANDEDYNNLPGCCQYNREMVITNNN